jgi:hypothetical protein
MQNIQLLALNKEELIEVIRDAFQEYLLDGFCNRYSSVILSPDDVAKMHGVNKATVIAYIKDGTINADQKKEYGAYRIRMSEALRLDFKKMKKNLKLKKHE